MRLSKMTMTFSSGAADARGDQDGSGSADQSSPEPRQTNARRGAAVLCCSRNHLPLPVTTSHSLETIHEYPAGRTHRPIQHLPRTAAPHHDGRRAGELSPGSAPARPSPPNRRPRPPSRSAPRPLPRPPARSCSILAPGLQGGHRRPRQGPSRSGSRMSLPYPEPGIRLIRQDRDRRVRREDAGVPGGTGRGRRDPRPPLQRTEGHGPAAAGLALQRGRLSRIAGRACSRSSFDFPRSSRRTICSSSTRSSTRRSASGCRAVSTRRCGLAEEAFTAELAKLVSHLTERLSGQEDGKPKIFRDSAVENLTEFFAAVPRAERPQQRATRPARGRRPAGHSRRRAAGTCVTTPGCGSTSPRRCQPRAERAGRPVGGPAAAEHPPSSAMTGHGHATRRRTRRGCPVHLQRGDRPRRTGQPRHHSGISRRARPAGTLAGRSVAGGRPDCSGRFRIAARPWRPSTLGWRPTGSAARAAGSRSPLSFPSPSSGDSD